LLDADLLDLRTRQFRKYPKLTFGERVLPLRSSAATFAAWTTSEISLLFFAHSHHSC
jgi:hypothetical protein